MSLLLALLALPADPPYAVGHLSGSWPGPSGAATADVYYPADVAGEGVPAADGEHPLVVFGHGYLMPASAYGWLPDALVPEGFVVAMLTTGGELFPDHGAFGQDFRTVAAGLASDAADPSSPLFGAVGERAAALGHSMGGGASLLAASGDTTFAAVANLAAAETSPSAEAAAGAVTQPLLVLSAGDDCVTPPAQQEALWAAAASPCKAWSTIAGGTHCQFASASSACDIGEVFCGSGIDGATQRERTLALLLPWLRGVLELDPAAWAEFQAASAGTAGISTQTSCDARLAVDSVAGLDAAAAGEVAVTGAGLDLVLSASVGGVSASLSSTSPESLVLALPPGPPGAFDLELDGLLGDLVVPGAVVRWPALDAGPAVLGGTLVVDVAAGAPGPFALLGSLAAGTPLALPGVGHVLGLAPPLIGLASGTTDAAGEATAALTVPGGPSLEGVVVRLQGYAVSASGPSFTNLVARTLES